MVESSADEVGEMMAALSFHVGEVLRNPYHLLVPAWMQDNVRGGSELVGGRAVPRPTSRSRRSGSGDGETAASSRCTTVAARCQPRPAREHC